MSPTKSMLSARVNATIRLTKHFRIRLLPYATSRLQRRTTEVVGVSAQRLPGFVPQKFYTFYSCTQGCPIAPPRIVFQTVRMTKKIRIRLLPWCMSRLHQCTAEVAGVPVQRLPGLVPQRFCTFYSCTQGMAGATVGNRISNGTYQHTILHMTTALAHVSFAAVHNRNAWCACAETAWTCAAKVLYF